MLLHVRNQLPPDEASLQSVKFRDHPVSVQPAYLTQIIGHFRTIRKSGLNRRPIISKTVRNEHEVAGTWFRTAAAELRADFAVCDATLPEKMRFNVGFTSQGKRAGRTTGETWPASASADGTVEIIIRIDQFDPIKCLGILVHQLIHSVTGKGHGVEFKELCLKLGMDATHGLRNATPGARMKDRIATLAAQLGPLPLAKLDWDHDAADKPKKQVARLLKVECRGPGCGYLARVAQRWITEVGAPHCPKHGEMFADTPEDIPDATNDATNDNQGTGDGDTEAAE